MKPRLPEINLSSWWPSKSILNVKAMNPDLAIGLVWLFHGSAIIGIYCGFEQWFIQKTPLNLISCFLLILAIGSLQDIKHAVAAYLFFMMGFLIEWVGTTYGIPFGTYHYGENLGFKLAGVPLLIGVNWAMLVLITGGISSQLSNNKWIKIILGASLMVFLDLFIEPNASRLDFWYWLENEIPLSNYIAWFGISLAMHGIFQQFIDKINYKFSLHLYLAQLVFFVSIYAYSNL